MPHIESKITIKAPLESVWKMAQDVEKLPEFMPDLDQVDVLARDQLTSATMRVVTDWHGRIKQFNRKLWWTEEDIWNSEEHSCHFWQLKGDFTEYRGVYQFAEDGGNTQVHLSIDYRFEIPLIGAMMQKVILKLMQENCDTMLRCLHDEAEKQAAREVPAARLEPRRIIDAPTD